MTFYPDDEELGQISAHKYRICGVEKSFHMTILRQMMQSLKEEYNDVESDDMTIGAPLDREICRMVFPCYC